MDAGEQQQQQSEKPKVETEGQDAMSPSKDETADENKKTEENNNQGSEQQKKQDDKEKGFLKMEDADCSSNNSNFEDAVQGDVSDSEENQAKAINIEEVANRKGFAKDDLKEKDKEEQTDEKDKDKENESENKPSYKDKIEEMKMEEMEEKDEEELNKKKGDDEKNETEKGGLEEEDSGLQPVNYELYDLEEALKFKESANEIFKKVQKNEGTVDDNLEAIRLYGCAIEVCPPEEKKHRAIFHNNLGIAYVKLDKAMEAKGQFSTSIELNPEYAKPLYHRMNLFKKEEEYDRAMDDANKILEIDPSFQAAPQIRSQIIPELERLQKIKFEKMKDEVMGNLKTMGNSLLGHFGMSTENFKMTQNADGTHNINYQP